MDGEARVCPFCGKPPGVGMFCEACGRNLQAVEQLPTWAEWEGEGRGEPRASAAGMQPLAERCADATAAFLAAMRAADNPGAVRTPMSKRSAFRRAGSALGWVLRPVDREDFEKPRRYEPGLVLTVEGRFHRLHSQLRGWGTRDFPHYQHTVEPDAIDMPVTERLIGELATVLRTHGLVDTDPSPDQRHE
ncbi:MAG: hypothetical protein ABW135_02065 [Thermoleophilaceae bacterium]